MYLSILVQFLSAYMLIISILLPDGDMSVKYLLGGTI